MWANQGKRGTSREFCISKNLSTFTMLLDIVFCYFSEIRGNGSLEFDEILFIAYVLQIGEANLSKNWLFSV